MSAVVLHLRWRIAKSTHPAAITARPICTTVVLEDVGRPRVSGLLRPESLERKDHVLRGQRVSIVELVPFADVERPSQAIWAETVFLGDIAIHVALVVENQQ